MNTVIHRAGDRGRGEFGWLTTRYSFSFANWYDPARTGFGKLIVINDDRISAGMGFGTHQHQDMEVITIVTAGTLTHKDSMGNEGTVTAGEVQVMSAGTGVAHSEYNASSTEALELFQIWILPKKLGIAPRYAQTNFPKDERESLTVLVGPEGTTPLDINQDAYIHRVILNADNPITYKVQQDGNGIYIMVISGSIEVAGETLHARDAIGVTDINSLELHASESSELLVIEVPMS